MKKCIAALFIGLFVAGCSSNMDAPSVTGTMEKETGQAIMVGTTSSEFNHVSELD